MNGLSHLGAAATAAAFLALALACGGGPRKAPVPEQQDATPSLGDLLGAQPVAPATPGTAAAPASPTIAAAPPAPPPLPEITPPTVVQEPDEVTETPECTQAREQLRAHRAEVDARRAREIGGLEKNLASGQLALQNCIKTSPCNQDAVSMAAATEKAQKAQDAYQAAMQRVAAWEADLFPYEQEMDRACGRR